jgi:hypothetical protein
MLIPAPRFHSGSGGAADRIRMSDLASTKLAIEAALKLLNVRLAAGDRAGALRGLNEFTRAATPCWRTIRSVCWRNSTSS